VSFPFWFQLADGPDRQEAVRRRQPPGFNSIDTPPRDRPGAGLLSQARLAAYPLKQPGQGSGSGGVRESCLTAALIPVRIDSERTVVRIDQLRSA